METVLVFSITNDLTGWRIDVVEHDNCFTVEQYDVDGAYMGSRTFSSDTKAISHAVLLS